MRIFLLTLALLFSFQIRTSEEETINWINENAIAIEDANPDSELVEFGSKAPAKFKAAKVFGFGEATHNSKEFFDLKAKFFKHLVRTQGVKAFIMEDAYQAEKGINEWISGGAGDKESIANNFLIGFWYTEEIVNLLAWMREYNQDKPNEEQVRFYGMDMQYGKSIDQELKDFVRTSKLKVDEGTLKAVEACASKMLMQGKTDQWADNYLPELRSLEDLLINQESNLDPIQRDDALRSLNYLMQYTEYVQNTVTAVRDSSMYENVKWIVEKKTDNGKAFVWAHNEHINKKEMYYVGSGITNLGRRLKDEFADDYYSVGFDFGSGKLRGTIQDKNEGVIWKDYTMEQPFKKTFAQVLFEADKDIYFLDMEDARANEPTGFFSSKNRNILVAAGGYQPKPLHKVMVNKVYTDFYDGLIFVKEVSMPDYTY